MNLSWKLNWIFFLRISLDRYQPWLDQLVAVFPREQNDGGRRFLTHETAGAGKTRRLKGALVRAVNALRKKIQRSSVANGELKICKYM